MARELREALPLATMHFVLAVNGNGDALREGRIDLDICSSPPTPPKWQ